MQKTIEIQNRNLVVLESSDKPETYGGEKIIAKQAKSCACFYLKINGAGTVVVLSGEKELERIELLANNKTNEYRLVVSHYGLGEALDISVKIGGRFNGVLLSSRFYGEKYSDEEFDVPGDGIYNTYNLCALAPDFGHLERVFYEDANTEAQGRRPVETRDYLVHNDHVLWLYRQKEGSYRLQYAKLLARVSPDTADEELEIDPELQPLIPLLVCFYVWHEDKPELAESMFAQYQLMAAEIKQARRAPSFPAVQDVYGW